ncbi:tetratricopeptide repeat protein [Flavobacterium rakeshii]|uniref:Tetratricopeptide repeat protein n=1 Tax=Flavobacterium rakeshii TaxID=1038845 RepID=A0A6N8HI13_9FLAO|nr:tetratricopeptide repeat protein [Flavobacterium rakeshii]MEE1897432.1 tetratricopeptide repeat protein [Flavobacterium rakeshii]MUV05382.1 tetratricopeptide repeat protein [Flavobacterium rakeshii]
MKKVFAFIALIWSVAVFAQNEQLAQNYFERGEFEKALLIYQDLEASHPGNTFFLQKTVACYQQMQQYNKAEELINERLEKTKRPFLYVELGYNYQLQGNTEKAESNYEKAINSINENATNVYAVAQNFEQKILPERAIKAYETATAINKSMNFDYQTAILQGQLGNMDLMIEKLLSFAYNNPHNLPVVKNQLSRFMMQDAQESFNEALRKALLVNTQKNQDIFWNEFLSWYYVQQKDYGKAFIQQKAIFRRDANTFTNIITLARLAAEENETETAKEIFTYILENSDVASVQLYAHQYLISEDIKDANEGDFAAIKQRINDLLEQYGSGPNTLDLQILKADFEAFHLKESNTGIATLNQALEIGLNRYQKAEVKMKLADILLLDEKFNQAIIYYAQIEDELKNDEVAHEASLKVAKASYFKGDFEWAQKQLKVLKSSSSQLIANDALELYLLIIDNTVEDSTQTALKKFARADYKLYQNKKQEALDGFKDILANDKTESIQDVTLLRVGRMYEDLKQFDLALQYYKQIIDNYAEGIYIDEALFYSAEIYNKILEDPEKAMPLYEKVIFNHEDSIHFVEARKQYRRLRGDANS